MKKTFKKLIAVMLTAVLCLSIMPFASAAIYGDHIFLRGDANADGAVNSSDALAILQFSVGKIDEGELNWRWADLNGDGTVNSSDALRILQISVGSDDPLKYDEKEIVKFYADALFASCQDPSEISYYSYYGSTMVNEEDETDYQEFDQEYDYTKYYVDGYDEYGYSTFEFCPEAQIPMEYVDSAEIEEADDGYWVTITLVEEQADFDDPIPEATFWYTANYADCTDSGLEGLWVYDATAYFYEVTISASIDKNGFVTELYLDIPFTMHMSLEDNNGEHYAYVREEGIITDSYTFVF